jgi:hypothetical protein
MNRQLAKRVRGLSKSIAVHGVRGHTRHTTMLKAGRQAEHIREMAERRAAELQGIFFIVLILLLLITFIH